jgi:hypothetical protein
MRVLLDAAVSALLTAVRALADMRGLEVAFTINTICFAAHQPRVNAP